MDSSTLSTIFEGLTFSLPPPTLQFEGGTVVIKLSSRAEDSLILHESVLAKASERFAMRFNSLHWAPSREVEMSDKEGRPQKLKVYEYRLIHADGTYTLTDEVCCQLILHFFKMTSDTN